MPPKKMNPRLIKVKPMPVVFEGRENPQFRSNKYYDPFTINERVLLKLSNPSSQSMMTANEIESYQFALNNLGSNRKSITERIKNIFV